MKTNLNDAIQDFLTGLTLQDELREDSVRTLLDKVRQTYDIDMVYVLEGLHSRLDFSYAYVSTAQPGLDKSGMAFHITDSDYAAAFDLFQGEPLSEKMCRKATLTPGNFCLQYGFLTEDAYQGALVFESLLERRWTREEREVISRLGRAVRMFLAARKARDMSNDRKRKVILALTDNCFCDFYVDVLDDSYMVIQLTERMKPFIPAQGAYDKEMEEYIRRFVELPDQQNMLERFRLAYIRKQLTSENRSFAVDFRRRVDGQLYWYRMAIVLADMTSDGMVHHAVITVQDVTEEIRERELNHRAFTLLKDTYCRISAVNLGKNRIVNLKILDEEAEAQEVYGEDFEGGIRWCADNNVDPEYREKFLSVFDTENLKALFEEQPSSVELTYRRLVRGEYVWVRSEIVPVDNYTPDNARVMWYVKNISQEKAKEAELTERIMQTNARLRTMLANEEKYRQALTDAYDAANRANSAKTDFLSKMSHDIRTPMNAIIGMTAIAGSHLDNRDKVADCLGKISVSSRHLLSLINEVLDMSKIESGKLSLAEEAFNLSDLIDNLLDMVRPSIEECGHELTVHIHHIQHEHVIGDSLRIQQAFVNIVGNAVKYTPPGGHISIDIAENPTKQVGWGCYEFIFRDNGIGMTPEFLEHIFEPFERAQDDRVNRIQGTGLGMAITRNIVQMMDGDIQVESELGKGTCFTVTIYLRQQDVEHVPVKELQGRSVLVVDDDPVCCETACAMLQELGMQSESVLSGAEALRLLGTEEGGKEPYFAMLLDWKMPETDGVELTRLLRQRLGADIPIIIMSAYDWSDIEMDARTAGADAFISKPLFPSRLLRLFQDMISGATQPEQESPMEEMAKRDFTGKRVLLVEDNELNREIAREILSMTGLIVEEAVNGREAVDMVTAAPEGYFDMIFMDIQMPEMNGYEATVAIRSMRRRDLRQLPIVAMTANAFAEDVQAARNCGMNEHIAKPLDIRQLMGTLEHWLCA